jgi:anti-sigma factor RsiW
MGSCKNKRLIGPFLDGQLGECKWLEDHIAECSECLAEYEMVQRISYLAGKSDFPPPESSYWKKFGTRVIARIAARPQTKRYPRLLESIFANKLALRLVTPLLVVLIAVVAVRLYNPIGQPVEDGANMQAVTDAPQAVSAIPGVISEFASMPALLKPQSDVYVGNRKTGRAQANAIDPSESIEKPAWVGTDYDENQAAADQEPIALTVTRDDQMLDDYLKNYQLNTSFGKLTGISSGLKADLAQNIRFRVFDTDQVLKFQILTGSNPSLAPLSSYREAAGKFFAPEISNSRNLFEQSVSSGWGYSEGEDNYNEERQRHLSLEFNLIKEK